MGSWAVVVVVRTDIIQINFALAGVLERHNIVKRANTNAQEGRGHESNEGTHDALCVDR